MLCIESEVLTGQNLQNYFDTTAETNA